MKKKNIILSYLFKTNIIKIYYIAHNGTRSTDPRCMSLFQSRSLIRDIDCVLLMNSKLTKNRWLFQFIHVKSSYVNVCLFVSLKGQLVSSVSGRLQAGSGGGVPLSDQERRNAEDRLHRLRTEMDHKRLAIKNLKLSLERLDITE